MNNILIPTALEPDIINAVKAGIKYSKNENCEIVLLLLSDVPDTYSSCSFLKNLNQKTTPEQQEILSACRQLVKGTNCRIKIHNQHGISGPILKGIIQHHDIKLMIITPTYRAGKKLENQCLQLLLNCKTPILHLGPYSMEQDFDKAMYIEYTKSKVKIEEMQRMVREIFTLQIISHATINDDHDVNDITPQLAEAILNNNIDLIVETRKPSRIKLKTKAKTTKHKLGLSILSLYEDLA